MFSASSRLIRSPRTVRLGVAILLLVFLAGLAAAIVDSQQQARRDVERRQLEHAATAAALMDSLFTQTYSTQGTDLRPISGRHVRNADVHTVVGPLSVGQTLVLDSAGRLLGAWPPVAGRGLVASDAIASDVRSALGGRPAVSPVAPATAHTPASAESAAPVDTPFGRRALINRYPLGVAAGYLRTYLTRVATLPGGHAYLVDGKLRLVAASVAGAALGGPLPDRHLADAVMRGGGGAYGPAGYFASAALHAAPYRIVITAPAHAVYAPVNGTTRRVPWLLYIGFALAAAGSLWLLGRLSRRSLLLRQTSRELDARDREVSARKQLEIQLQYQADHDPLTGLFNRRRLVGELERRLPYANRYQHEGAVLLIDLDHFKFVNDSHGHAAGDVVLIATAELLRARMRETDVVARLGGDEFAVILSEADEPQAVAVAADLSSLLRDSPVGPQAQVSIGIGLFGMGRQLEADELLIAADIALYDAKERGGDQVRVYTGEASAALTWVDRIRTALDQGRLILFGQPIVDLSSGATTHHEVLIRMVSDDGDIIPPGSFLPTAERFGLINDIDRWVAGEALRFAEAGQNVSINLSAHSIGDDWILARVAKAVERGVAPGSVIFEITETAAVTNMSAARSFAQSLMGLGCELALDDFGTGFGSFSHLKNTPVHVLKIDLEFVQDVVENATDQQVIKSIVGIAHSLGQRAVAEGVETAAQLDMLRHLGVDAVQGYFVGDPKRLSPLTELELSRASRTAPTLPVAALAIRPGRRP
jgi:diguanylate cyclase (GGDEF)-like protein